MPKAILFIFLSVQVFFCAGQNQEKIVSIENKIAAEKTDTGKVTLYNELFFEYRDYDSAKAMAMANDGLALSRKIGDKKGESLLLYNKANFLNVNGDQQDAKNLLTQSFNIRKQAGDLAGQGYCYRAFGNISYDNNDYKKALEYYLSAATLFEKVNDLKGLSGTYIWIGNVFNDGLRQFDKAVEYFNKSLAIADQLKDSVLIGYNYNNLGQANYYQKKYKEALYYYDLCMRIKTLKGDLRGTANTNNNISTVFFDLKKYDSAIIYNDSALHTRLKINDKKGVATSYLNAGNIFLILEKYEQAFDNYQLAIKVANEIDFKEPVIEAYNGLSQYYEAKGDTKEALSFYKKYKSANDSVFNSDITKQLSTLEIKYSTAQKEQLIEKQQFDLTKKQYWIYGSAGAALLILLLSISYYRRNKLKSEKRLQTELMKHQDIATKAVIEAEEKERKRIASDLHDGVGQMMSVAKMNLSAFEGELSFKNEQQQNSFENVINLIDESCKEIRSVSHQMMPNALLKSGLASAIKEFIDKIDSRIIKVSLYTEGLNEKIDSNTETVLYRVVQECVNNVLKHSGANRLDISMIKDADGIAVSIEDNGKGFDASKKQNSDGIGLKNITSRISYLKGTIEFDSSPGNGTLVAIHVPVDV